MFILGHTAYEWNILVALEHNDVWSWKIPYMYNHELLHHVILQQLYSFLQAMSRHVMHKMVVSMPYSMELVQQYDINSTNEQHSYNQTKQDNLPD